MLLLKKEIIGQLEKGQVLEGSLVKEDTMDAHVDSGNDPVEIALKVTALLHKKNPKPHYVVGSFLHKFSITLKKFLPQKAYEKLLKNHYKL